MKKTTSIQNLEASMTKLPNDVVAADDIASILQTIKDNNSTQDVIVDNGVVKTVPKNDSDKEDKTKLSDDIVAGYWYDDYPKIYQFEKESLREHQNKMGASYFSFIEGKTTDNKLYFVVSVKLKIDKILPNYKVHKFLLVYGHNFNNETSGAFGGKSLKVYPAVPDEKYYYKNGEIFHHLWPTDEANRHYMCRSTEKSDARYINAYNSVEELLRWLFVFYVWKSSGTDIDR